MAVSAGSGGSWTVAFFASSPWLASAPASTRRESLRRAGQRDRHRGGSGVRGGPLFQGLAAAAGDQRNGQVLLVDRLEERAATYKGAAPGSCPSHPRAGAGRVEAGADHAADVAAAGEGWTMGPRFHEVGLEKNIKVEDLERAGPCCCGPIPMDVIVPPGGTRDGGATSSRPIHQALSPLLLNMAETLDGLTGRMLPGVARLLKYQGQEGGIRCAQHNRSGYSSQR